MDCQRQEEHESEEILIERNFLGTDISHQLINIETELVKKLNTLAYPQPVAYVYSPLEYARKLHTTFVHTYCQSTKALLFLGMNPGPFGMAQTGVPFGDVDAVKNWLQITGEVDKPPNEHPKRKIYGLSCPRNEVSGQRFWGLFKDICKMPEHFFKNAFVYNYCPLMFMKETSKNVTPNELKSEVQKILGHHCDEALRKVTDVLQTKTVIALGRYAEKRAKLALDSVEGIDIRFLMHPSPINPAANRGWTDLAKNQLEELGLVHYLIG